MKEYFENFLVGAFAYSYCLGLTVILYRFTDLRKLFNILLGIKNNDR